MLYTNGKFIFSCVPQIHQTKIRKLDMKVKTIFKSKDLKHQKY